MKIKKLELETSKGRFVVEEASDKNLGRVLLKHITEEQAGEIVDYTNFIGFAVYEDYQDCNKVLYTAIESLQSLIKSNGWYLENPYKKPEHYDLWSKYGDFTQYGKSLTESVERWQQAESRTLHNPVIFKIK